MINIKNKIVVIEEVSFIHLLDIYFYSLLGYKIYYLRLTQKIKDNRLFSYAVKNNLISRLELATEIATSGGVYSEPALDNIEEIYKLFSHDKLIEKMTGLYGDKRAELAFKKSTVNKAAKFYYINELLYQAGRKFSSHDICYFIPSNGTERFRSRGDDVYFYLKFKEILEKNKVPYKGTGRILFPRRIIFISGLNYYKSYFSIYIKAFLSILWFIYRFASGLISRSLQQAKYRYGVIIVSPLTQFANQIQKVDFLLDNKNLNKTNTIFIFSDRLETSRKKQMTKNGLHFIDNLPVALSGRSLLTVLAYSRFAFLAKIKTQFILDTYVKLLVIFAKWNDIPGVCRMDNLISHGDFGLQSIGRNILLKKHNPAIKTWYYMHSISFNLFLAPNANSVNIRYLPLSFLFYDYFLTWSDFMAGYFRRHDQTVDSYICVGCLWSEHIVELSRQEKIADYLGQIDKYKQSNNKYRVVAVFDTTFSDDMMRTSADGMEFLQGICRLLQDMPDIFVILKEKKERKTAMKYCPQVVDFYKELEKHPRCYLPLMRASPSEIISVSELVISFPFTSTTYEAIAARKKAVYYDASGKFKNTLYDEVPGLVCHGYLELKQRASELLFRINSDEYNKYLDEFVKGKFEPRLDGRGLSRFRELLAGDAATG